MEISGILEIPALAAVVWAALHDPLVLAQCVSGCDSLEAVGPDALVATGSLKLGPMRARITVNIAFADSEPPRRTKLHLMAGTAMGSAEAHATITLAETKSGTRLAYAAQGNLAGGLGRLAGRRSEAAAQELVETFFARFAAAIPIGADERHPEPDAALPRATPVPPRPSLRKNRKTLWIGIAAGFGTAAAAAAAILVARNRRS